jgi:hypothetical protein
MASLRKTRPVSDPYEVWSDGSWKWRVLKFYKTRENTLADPYGRVFCEVEGDFTELGDVYYKEITDNAQLVSTNYGE